MSSKEYKKEIIDALLRKYNIRYAKNITTNRRIILKPTEVYKDYAKNNADILEKQGINEAVSVLNDMGFITVDYLKFSDDIDKVYLFSSTAATYGEPERIPIMESDRTLPTNCYGETKLSMEKMFKWTANAHNLRFVSLRYFNACGAHPNGKIGEAHNPETHLIPLILQVPNEKREYISIYGTDYDTKDGTCVRDYIHVNDLAQAHILAMKYLCDGNDSNIFNLGNGVGFTVKEVVETARKVTGHPIPAKEEPRRAGDPSMLIASSAKAREVLGWNPQYADLETIIGTAWKWHKSHPNGYQNV